MNKIYTLKENMVHFSKIPNSPYHESILLFESNIVYIFSYGGAKWTCMRRLQRLHMKFMKRAGILKAVISTTGLRQKELGWHTLPGRRNPRKRPAQTRRRQNNK